MAAKYRWLLRIANGMICPAYHVRPLRGLSTLSSCYPRSLSRLGFRRLQPKLVRRPGVIHSVTPPGSVPYRRNRTSELSHTNATTRVQANPTLQPGGQDNPNNQEQSHANVIALGLPTTLADDVRKKSYGRGTRDKTNWLKKL